MENFQPKKDNIFLKSAVLLGKILILAILVLLFFGSLFASKGDNIQLGFTIFILIFIILPTIFIFFFKKKFLEKHPKFIIFWKFLRIIYAVILILFIAIMISGLYKFYQVKSTQKAIDFINSEKITLDDVMGKNLPPVPDQKLNDSTIAGIDANNNYIRDDVELAIFKQYPNSAKIRAAELQYAQETQMELTNIFDSDTWVAVVKNENNGISCMVDCAFEKYSNITDQISKTHEWQNEVDSLVFNTVLRQEKRKEIKKYETAYTVGDGRCDISIDKLDN